MYRSYMDTSISFHKHQKYNSKQMTFIRRFNLRLIFVIYFRECGARVKTPVSRSSEISTVRIFNYKALTLLYITFKFLKFCFPVFAVFLKPFKSLLRSEEKFKRNVHVMIDTNYFNNLTKHVKFNIIKNFVLMLKIYSTIFVLYV